MMPEERINFFLKVHSSIVSPDYYTSIADFSVKTVGVFVLQVCFLTAVITGGAYTFYALDADKGLPARITAMLPGMSIKNGVLDPGRTTPFYPSKSSVSNVIDMVFCIPGLFEEAADSSIVVDTMDGKTLRAGDRAKVLLAGRYLEIQSKSYKPIRFAYAKWMPGVTSIIFTKSEIRRFLLFNITGVAFNFFMLSGAIHTCIFCMSIMFLGFAACIFRIEKKETVGKCFKMACFAVSPMFVGVNIIALSGAQFAVGWHIMLILSTVVLFRGINAERKALSRLDKVD